MESGLSEVLVVVFLALTVEALWETSKMIWQSGKLNVDAVGALVIGLLIAFTKPLDLFEIIGYGFAVPYVGMFCTGVLISRGANFIHDYLGKKGKLAA